MKKTRSEIVKEFLESKAKNVVVGAKANYAENADLKEKFFKGLARQDRGAMVEVSKALGDGQNITNNGDGGYLVPTELSANIIEKLKYLSPIREMAKVINLGGKLELPIEDGAPTASWVDEGASASLSKATFNKLPLTAHKLSVRGKFTYESLNDTATNPSLQAFVESKFAKAIAEKENEAFVNGDGNKKPTGFRDASFTGVNKVNVKEAGKLAYGDLVKLVFSVSPAYRAKGVFAVSTQAMEKIVALVDGNGRPIYVPAMAEGAPATVLGYPVYEVAEIPANLGAGKNETEIWFGDFENYIIGDNEGLRVAFGTSGEDLDNDMITLVMFKRTAGVPTLGESFAVLNKVPTV